MSISFHRHNQKKRKEKGEKIKVSLWWELLYFTVLLAFLHVIQQGELKSSCCTLITSLVLMYLIFVLFDHLPPYPLLPPLTSGNQKSDLFFCDFDHLSDCFWSCNWPVEPGLFQAQNIAIQYFCTFGNDPRGKSVVTGSHRAKGWRYYWLWSLCCVFLMPVTHVFCHEDVYLFKTIPKKKRCEKGKMVVWEGLTDSWEKKRR